VSLDYLVEIHQVLSDHAAEVFRVSLEDGDEELIAYQSPGSLPLALRSDLPFETALEVPAHALIVPHGTEMPDDAIERLRELATSVQRYGGTVVLTQDMPNILPAHFYDTVPVVRDQDRGVTELVELVQEVVLSRKP